jgi:hypothetical protein
MQDPESPRPEQIEWNQLRSPLKWVGAELLREVIDRDKLQKIIVAQVDFRIDVMRREIEQLERIRDIIAEE